MSRSIVLCADDFGMSAGINRAILNLMSRGRLSATSCMTTLPAWWSGAAELSSFRGRAAIGLHLNLTEGEGARPLRRTMVASLVRRLSPAKLAEQVDRQLDAFEDALGTSPDFVDGHQHVQMFPQVRDVLCAALALRYQSSRPWLRIARPPLFGHDAFPKAIVLRGTGIGFEVVLRRAGLRGTRHFAGLYSLRPDADFAGLMEGWIGGLPEGALVMCHPGSSGEAVALARTREAEAAYLGSARFGEALHRHGVRLDREPAVA